MTLNFTVNRIVEIKHESYTAKVTSVVTAAGEDITERFFSFCKENDLRLDLADAIENATRVFGRKHYP